MSTTVFFARHGAHDRLGNVLCGRMHGVSMNDDGRRQADALSRRLKGEDLAAVYSSPLDRTRETAEPIAAAAGLPVVEDEALLEIDFGDWTGTSFDDLRDDPLWTAWNNARAVARPPGGESMVEVQSRLKRWLDTARARHGEARIAAVTHADVIKAVTAYALGFSLDQHDRLEISPGSVTSLVAGDWGVKVLSVNETMRWPA